MPRRSFPSWTRWGTEQFLPSHAGSARRGSSTMSCSARTPCRQSSLRRRFRSAPICASLGAQRMATKGRLVVLEGIDGAGTTTHVARLAERLRSLRVPVRATREPSDGPVGTLVRQVLTGRMVVPGGRAPGWATMALLFAADRMDHVESEIEPFLAEGGV